VILFSLRHRPLALGVALLLIGLRLAWRPSVCGSMTMIGCITIAGIVAVLASVLAVLVRAVWLAVAGSRALATVRREPVLAELAAAGRRAGVHRLVCLAGDSPVAFCAGVLRPRVYVSRGTFTALSDDELTAVLHDRRGVEVVRIRIPEPPTYQNVLDTYSRALHDHGRVRLLLLTHMNNRTGLVLPVREIVAMARGRGVDVIVDAAHSWGQLDFSVPDLGADFGGFTLHKWINAPLGSGFLYVRKSRLKDIDPAFADQTFPPTTSVHRCTLAPSTWRRSSPCRRRWTAIRPWAPRSWKHGSGTSATAGSAT
jgi:hypothetical protein